MKPLSLLLALAACGGAPGVPIPNTTCIVDRYEGPSAALGCPLFTCWCEDLNTVCRAGDVGVLRDNECPEAPNT